MNHDNSIINKYEILEEILDLPRSNTEIVTLEPVEPVSHGDQDADDDYKLTRENVRHILQRGGEALDILLTLAKASENAKTFDSLSSMIKTLVEANKDLLEIQKSMQELTGKSQKKGTSYNDNRSVTFVGTSNDLLDNIKKNGKSGQ